MMALAQYHETLGWAWVWQQTFFLRLQMNLEPQKAVIPEAFQSGDRI